MVILLTGTSRAYAPFLESRGSLWICWGLTALRHYADGAWISSFHLQRLVRHGLRLILFLSGGAILHIALQEFLKGPGGTQLVP
jgi:hypothetical protein